MENGNGTSSTNKSDSMKKVPPGRGLRNFRMDKESSNKGQASLLRYFRSAKAVDSEYKDTLKVVNAEEASEEDTKKSVTTTLVNKPSSTVSFRHTVKESPSPTKDSSSSPMKMAVSTGSVHRDGSTLSNKTESDNDTICSQSSVQTEPEEPSSPILKRRIRENSMNGGETKEPSKPLFVQPLNSNKEGKNVKAETSVASPLGGISMELLVGNKSNIIKSPSITDNDSQDSPIILVRKRPRVIDSDEDDSNPPPKKSVVNGHGSSSDESTDMPDDDTIEKFLDMWISVYPHVNRMEALDAFKDHHWDVKSTMLHLGKVNGERKSSSKVKNLEELLAKKKELVEQNKEKKRLQRIEKDEQLRLQREERNRQRDELKQQRDAVRQKESAERAAHRERLLAQKAAMKAKSLMKNDGQDMEEEEDEFVIGNKKVYESDDDSDVEPDMSMTPDRSLVLSFFNDANVGELAAIQGCNKKKAELIIDSRPFEDWEDIVYKFKGLKSVSPDLLNQAKSLLHVRKTVQQLMKRCEKIAKDMQSIVTRIVSGEEDAGISKQPEILNSSMALKNYQLIGLNWLVLMHDQGLNGVLADEMGLGKTVQAISFLGYIKEMEDPEKASLIIVPSSTFENWSRELETWCPSLNVLQYHGSQEERRGMRISIINDQLEEDPDVILTTYNMVTSSAEDRALFKKLRFKIVVLDEAHMLKNMASQRYEQLMKIKGERRVLLTGTPLQNNLVELMSILIFVMPQLFDSKRDELKKVFSLFPKGENAKSRFEQERIEQAKRIMKPFFLRRLKKDVLSDLPPKTDRNIIAPLSEKQQKLYSETVSILSKRAQQRKMTMEDLNIQKLTEIEELEATASFDGKGKKEGDSVAEDTSSNMVMTLRKIANHPLLIRSHYDLKQLKEMAKILKKSSHRDSVVDYIVEDFSVMSDFQIHKTCRMYPAIRSYSLSNEEILRSGKFEQLDTLLPKLKEEGNRVLIFSQFVMVLDILEQYIKIRGHKYTRIDGSTQVTDRQMLIDLYTEDENIFIFMLSTRAGGLGINLTAADTVIIHDIDFNPYNDKQAEDRCHRVGQTKPVQVIRLVSKDTIEEGMLQIAQEKLQLEKDVTGRGEDQQKKGDLVSLLKDALGLAKLNTEVTKEEDSERTIPPSDGEAEGSKKSAPTSDNEQEESEEEDD